MADEVPIHHWAEYLEAFDALLAARIRRDGEGALLARRRMVAYLEASPDYWRARSTTRDRQERVRQDRQERFFRLLVDRRRDA